MAIVSNGDQEIIETRLRNANIEHHFEFVITPCSKYPLTKPDIKIFSESLKILNIDVAKTIYVGDNPEADVLGANNAGMFSVLIDRYNSTNNLKGLLVPDLKITSLEQMKILFQ